MISKKTRTNRLRRHRKLKRLYEARLELAVSDNDKKHLKARIAEIDRDIETTKGDSVKEGNAPPIPGTVEYIEAEREKAEEVTPQEPKALLPVVAGTVEEDAETLEEHIVQSMESKTPEPKRKLNKVKKVGNPF